MEIRQRKTAHIPILFLFAPPILNLTYVQLGSDTPCHTKLNNPSLELFPYALLFIAEWELQSSSPSYTVYSMQLYAQSLPPHALHNTIYYTWHTGQNPCYHSISIFYTYFPVLYCRTIDPLSRPFDLHRSHPCRSPAPQTRSTDTQPDSSHPTTRVSVPLCLPRRLGHPINPIPLFYRPVYIPAHP